MTASAGDWKQSLTLIGKVLASGHVATTGIDTTIFTVPVGYAAKIATASLTNVADTDVIVSLSVVPGGSVLDISRKVIPAVTIPANSIYPVEVLFGAFLETGAFISVNAGTPNAVNFLITGALSA